MAEWLPPLCPQFAPTNKYIFGDKTNENLCGFPDVFSAAPMPPSKNPSGQMPFMLRRV